MFFYSPTEVAEKPVQPGARLRVGGLVEAGFGRQIRRAERGLRRDRRREDLAVAYQGLAARPVPRGPGRRCRGRARRRRASFAPRPILAKHDERYMPREVVDALKKQGRWQEGEASAK